MLEDEIFSIGENVEFAVSGSILHSLIEKIQSFDIIIDDIEIHKDYYYFKLKKSILMLKERELEIKSSGFIIEGNNLIFPK